jgi:hypothetical protein
VSKKQTFAEAAEEVAFEGLAAMKAFLAYQGSNPDYLKKAKVGAVAVGSYTRLRATLANERQLDLLTQRLAQKALTDGEA